MIELEEVMHRRKYICNSCDVNARAPGGFYGPEKDHSPGNPYFRVTGTLGSIAVMASGKRR
jgi:hypothetical protein